MKIRQAENSTILNSVLSVELRVLARHIQNHYIRVSQIQATGQENPLNFQTRPFKEQKNRFLQYKSSALYLFQRIRKHMKLSVGHEIRQAENSIILNIASGSEANMTILCEMEFFNFLWLIWVHYLPLPPTQKDRPPRPPQLPPGWGPNLPNGKFTI